jgi:phospholipase/lecithinase/hemolysin
MYQESKMKPGKLKYAWATIVPVLLLSAFSALADERDEYEDSGLERLFIFGDSLSDSGNIYELTGAVSRAPYALIPSAPYAIGGHRFTNGKTWAERLAGELELEKGGKPSLKKPGKNGNYAFGGARARSGSGSQAPDSATQIAMFLGDFGTAPADALYVVQFGGNDLRDALLLAAIDPGGSFAIMQAAIAATAANVQSLYVAGARNFLVANAPDLAHAPAVRLAGASDVAGLFVGFYNGFLEGTLQQLEMSLPGIVISRLDIAAFLDDVVANPADYDFRNVDNPCLTFYVKSDAKCEEPEEYLFWDGIHPTAAGHEALSDWALDVIVGNQVNHE